MKRMKPVVFSLSLAAALILGGVQALAHHGTSVSYDMSNPVSLTGTVTEFRYTNPHPQLFFDVKDEKGNVVHWSGEFYPNPSQLIQNGWGRKRSEAALAPGTEIKITVAPARVGGPIGAIMKLTNAKDEVLLGVAPGDSGAAPPAPPPDPKP
jgi:hypothetical protein